MEVAKNREFDVENVAAAIHVGWITVGLWMPFSIHWGVALLNLLLHGPEKLQSPVTNINRIHGHFLFLAYILNFYRHQMA